MYFVLYVPTLQIPLLSSLRFVLIPRPVVSWFADKAFGAVIPFTGVTGSGDTMLDWMHAFCALMLAAVATVIWSVLDRRRPNYERLHMWLRLFVRFGLGFNMITYGMIKAIPVQMPDDLFRLTQTFADFSPMGVLWTSVGAFPAYERFLGSVELVAGILLFVPSTVLLGALISLTATIQVFVLNMTYDVPVKLLSFHLILLCLLLLAPDARRLANLLLLDRPAAPSARPALGTTSGRRRLATIAQVGVGVLITTHASLSAMADWNRYGVGAPKPPLYGIWQVEEMKIDGVVRAPLITDPERWRRTIFERRGLVIQKMDGPLVFYQASVDASARTLDLTFGSKGPNLGHFRFGRHEGGQLSLDGELGFRKISARLRLLETSGFLLKGRGFHWVQEYPFNR